MLHITIKEIKIIIKCVNFGDNDENESETFFSWPYEKNIRHIAM